MNEIKASDNQSEFVQLINVREIYKKWQNSDLSYEWSSSEQQTHICFQNIIGIFGNCRKYDERWKPLSSQCICLFGWKRETNEWLSLQFQCVINYWENKSFLPRWIVNVKIRTIVNYSRELGMMPWQIPKLD